MNKTKYVHNYGINWLFTIYFISSLPVCVHLSSRCHSLCPQPDWMILPHQGPNTGSYRGRTHN